MKVAIAFSALGVVATLSACAPKPEAVGRDLYADYCTSCHGVSGRGDGPLAGSVGRAVPDLTLIAARNDGTFPTASVLSTIDGYTRVRAGNVTMPEFGIELQAGPLVMYDSGDGIATPTPSRLVALAEYLRAIQR
jgi:mono/diheme cytochrome c family protein